VIEIHAVGPLATVQDLGRPGHAAVGVARSGAFDRGALRLANRLVGNRSDAAAVEITFGGLHVRLADPATVAFTGASCSGAPDWGAPLSLPAGTQIRLGAPLDGLRSYLAIRGGVAVPAVLGSRSTDTLSGLGPAPLCVGDLLPIGSASDPVVGASASGRARTSVLPVRLGPRDDWFTAAAVNSFLAAEWIVRAESDRIGIRLAGPRLDRIGDGELPSEPTLPGAVQVPPGGRPIVLGPDAPVTGGYPVLAVVTDLDPAAQLRPGDTVRFSS
jgi:biotin-dependent carboxylase-like uncharacterized protein